MEDRGIVHILKEADEFLVKSKLKSEDLRTLSEVLRYSFSKLPPQKYFQNVITNNVCAFGGHLVAW